MSVRFRKTVSLGKGARVNFSKSGASMSFGPRGASVSHGKRGTYVNIGIPGTGLSTRTKIGGSSGGRSKSRSSSGGRSSAGSSGGAKKVSPERAAAMATLEKHSGRGGALSLKASLSDTGEISFIFSDTGEKITDKAVIREIKRMPETQALIGKLEEKQRRKWDEMQRESEEESREFVEIYKLAPEVLPAEEYSRQLEELRPDAYDRREFDEPKPTQAQISKALRQKAENEVRGVFGRKKKVEEYMSANMAAFGSDLIAQWESRRREFEAEEDEREASENERAREEYEEEKAALEAALSTDEDTVLGEIEDWIYTLSVPADVGAQIDYKGGCSYLDLDLPEIEDLPQQTTKRLKSGQVKIVDKTQKQLKQEYATCVLGLAFFMAANIFNVNANITEVVVSGYTQRRDRNGDIADDYIFSVRFPREQLAEKSVKDPLKDINDYENRMKLSTAFHFGKIKPYDPPQ